MSTPMSNPKRIPIGTSRNLLKEVVFLRDFSHSSGMKGVLIINRLGDDIATLGIVEG